MAQAERGPGAVTRRAESIEAGAAAGMIGGVAMLVLLCTWAIATNHNVLEPLQWFGALFYGDDALRMGFGSALWGLVIHLAVATALGVPFAMFVGEDPDAMTATGAGIVYGLFAWLVLTFILLPLVVPTMARAVAQNPIIWFAAHVPYGAALSLSVQIRHALDVRERRLQHA
jgi:hypothetical protein